MNEEKKQINALNAEEMKNVESIDEVRKIYKDSNSEFKQKVDAITETSELEKLESELMTVMDEHDKYVKEATYQLPEEVSFEDERFARNTITTRIKTFLERNEVEFTYVFGLYGLAKFWAGNPKEITYGALDSTLRLLEQLKYGGRDWRNILIINAFFQKSNEEYNKDMSRTIFLAERHNIILERMQLLNPVPAPEGE